MSGVNSKSKLLLISIVLIISIIVISAYSSLKVKKGDNAGSDFQNENQNKNEQTLGQNIKELNESKTNLSEKFKVVRVIDGDTIEIEGGQKVRYIGIDTPETSDPRKSVECFSKEASQKNKELVEGKEVSLEKDVTETDKYGRLLRYVYVNDLFVNDYLVRQGFASSYTYPPDVKYQEQFTSAQKEAQENQRGVWSACSGNPEVESSAVTGTNSCQIKGNISSSGEKIYHLPGQRYYDKTQINESKSEQWFCTEAEAISAGWRKSKI